MASHNLDLARSVVGDLHGMFDLFDEDIVWDSRAYELPHGVTMLERGLYRGKRAVIDQIKDYVGTWSDYRFEVEELAEVADSVVLTVHETARGRGSGSRWSTATARSGPFTVGGSSVAGPTTTMPMRSLRSRPPSDVAAALDRELRPLPR